LKHYNTRAENTKNGHKSENDDDDTIHKIIHIRFEMEKNPGARE
jgi:hypothetical protein